MEDCRNNRASKAIEEVALNIFINTGMVSNMVDSAKYNTSLAHAFFNASTTLPQIEARHKHGEVVSYGTLLLLTLDKQYDKLERFFDFYKGMELPTSWLTWKSRLTSWIPYWSWQYRDMTWMWFLTKSHLL